ncbi:substrate-binding domain-containing protein [Tessaracoccus caeni]|uniref:substrate-binding domain-containing protein n=1 Tax=Tessaracoccus caeni TaxID=3031239 RepID=UPI0023D9A7DF|nr:substrate-binding domain-containing protein [Tessaracoccus caeni]MDF1487174.1 substrate-binding domain-containing protein [Tessaracoccus caeni]
MSHKKYYAMTLLVGFLAIPLLVPILAFALLVAPDLVGIPSGRWQDMGLVIAPLVALATSLLIWRWFARRPSRPPEWAKALLPVVLVPAYFLLVWVISFAVVEERTDLALQTVSFGFAFPWGLGFVLAELLGAYGIAPLMLIATLVGSVGGFLWGCRANPPTGVRARRVIVAGSLVLAVGASGQLGYREYRAWQWDSLERVSSEVDLWLYHPWGDESVVVQAPTPSSLTISEQFPLLDGATALYPVYSAAARAVYDPPMPTDSDDIYEFANTYVACNRTSEAYDRLINGDADAIFVLQPSQGHLEKAERRGVQLNLTPIGHDAFVFFVNADNPVEGLTLDQVRAIYTRQITNWAELGGADEEIVAYQRPEDSGSQTAMLAEVMGDVPMAEPLTEELSWGMGMVIESVAEYRNQTAAIGYSFRWYATEMNGSPRIKLLAIDGVAPSPENIADGSYPLTVDLYAATAGSDNPHVPELVDWMVSDEGQALVDAVGYVPLAD